MLAALGVPIVSSTVVRHTGLLAFDLRLAIAQEESQAPQALKNMAARMEEDAKVTVGMETEAQAVREAERAREAQIRAMERVSEKNKTTRRNRMRR